MINDMPCLHYFYSGKFKMSNLLNLELPSSVYYYFCKILAADKVDYGH